MSIAIPVGFSQPQYRFVSNDEQLAKDNARLVRMARDLMKRYAITWRLLRKDPLQQMDAANALCDAIRLRDMANRWQQHPANV